MLILEFENYLCGFLKGYCGYCDGFMDVERK